MRSRNWLLCLLILGVGLVLLIEAFLHPMEARYRQSEIQRLFGRPQRNGEWEIIDLDPVERHRDRSVEIGVLLHFRIRISKSLRPPMGIVGFPSKW